MSSDPRLGKEGPSRRAPSSKLHLKRSSSDSAKIPTLLRYVLASPLLDYMAAADTSRQSYQRSMQSSRMPSPPRNGPPYRHPGEPAYESPHTQPQLHQRQSTGPPQQQPLAPQHPQQGGNGRPTAQQQAHMLRAQEAAHAAAAAAQQAQAMRANGELTSRPLLSSDR